MFIFKRLFSGVQKEYLYKSYLISFLITALILICQVQSGFQEMSFIIWVWILGSFVLFPFSAIVWDDLINLLTNGTIFVLPGWLMVIWKLFKVMMLYTFSFVVAPFGIIYILIKNK